jgi:hypothetical protein
MRSNSPTLIPDAPVLDVPYLLNDLDMPYGPKVYSFPRS